MRQVLFVMLITLTVLGSEELSLAQHIPQTADLSTASLAPMRDQTPTSLQNVIAQSPVVAQAPNKPHKDEKKPDKDGKKSSDRAANYECLEYCTVVRQSCEGLTAIQPDPRIADVGSKENNEWSRECQKIYVECMNKCDFDESSVHWKKAKNKDGKTK